MLLLLSLVLLLLLSLLLYLLTLSLLLSVFCILFVFCTSCLNFAKICGQAPEDAAPRPQPARAVRRAPLDRVGAVHPWVDPPARFVICLQSIFMLICYKYIRPMPQCQLLASVTKWAVKIFFAETSTRNNSKKTKKNKELTQRNRHSVIEVCRFSNLNFKVEIFIVKFFSLWIEIVVSIVVYCEQDADLKKNIFQFLWWNKSMDYVCLVWTCIQ